MDDSELRPRMPIRRFDVFAEYQRLEGLERGLDEAHAAGYGLWVAKVVASGRAGRAGTKARQAGEPVEGGQRPEAPAAQEWHVLGGEPQTEELFDREVVGRMGPDFYRQVFAPAIARAHRQGKSYESVRDAIRKGWTLER